MSFLSILLSPAALSTLMWGCFIIAGSCLALNAHLRAKEMQRLNAEILGALRQIVDNTKKK